MVINDATETPKHPSVPLADQPKYARYNLASKLLGGAVAGVLAFGIFYVTFMQ